MFISAMLLYCSRGLCAERYSDDRQLNVEEDVHLRDLSFDRSDSLSCHGLDNGPYGRRCPATSSGHFLGHLWIRSNILYRGSRRNMPTYDSTENQVVNSQKNKSILGQRALEASAKLSVVSPVSPVTSAQSVRSWFLSRQRQGPETRGSLVLRGPSDTYKGLRL